MRFGVARLLPVAVLLAFALLLLRNQATARIIARFTPEDWQRLFSQLNEQAPRGVFYDSGLSQQLHVYERLRKARGVESGNIIHNARIYRLASDEVILDRLNNVDIVAIFRPQFAQASLSNPFKRYHDRFNWRSWSRHGLVAQFAELGRKVFVMRGHGDVPLCSRLRLGPNKYQLDVFHEVPGIYTVHADRGRLTQAEWDGTPLQIAPAARGSAATFQLTIGTSPTLARPLRLTFADAASSSVTLRWDLQDQATAFTPVAPGLSAAPLRIDSVENAVQLNLNLHVGQGLPLLVSCAVRLIEPGKEFGLIRWSDIPVDAPRRGLEPGDTIWTGPLTVTREQAKAIGDRVVALELIPIRLNFGPGDPEYLAYSRSQLTPQQIREFFAQMPARQVVKLRFRVEGDRILVIPQS